MHALQAHTKTSSTQALQHLVLAAMLLPIALLALFYGAGTATIPLFIFATLGLGLIFYLARRVQACMQAQLDEIQQQHEQSSLLAQQNFLREQQEQEAIHAVMLQKSTLLLSNLTEQVPGAMFQLQQDANGLLSFPYSSLAIQELFEVTQEEISRDGEILLARLRAEDLALFRQDLAQADQALHRDLRVELPKAGLAWRACHARALKQEDGSLLWHGIFMDITDRQQQAGAIIEANARADAASQAKSAYLENMTHEIRTPMNIILGMSYLTLETELAPSQRDYLENIRISAEHLLSLINDILDLSKIEAGLLEVETIEFDLHETVAKLSKLMVSKINDKGLRFETHIAPTTPNALLGDPLRVSQVLINFIANAIKFTQQGTISLHISCHEQTVDGALIDFEVRDTGIGMTEKECSRMFQHFQQADASISRKYGGTGLGLAISKQLVELMGGTVGVESTPGKGSKFKFSIRVAKNLDAGIVNREQEAQAAQAAAALAKAAMQGRKILLVEDQPLNQRVAQAMLKNAGAQVELAENGQVALNILRIQHFDCVLMDMQMPVMDGVVATRAIRADPALANNLVIAMTANASMHNQAMCMAAGMNDFITKPIKPALLYAALAKWLCHQPKESDSAQELAMENNAVRATSSFNLSTLSQLVGNDPALLRKFALMFVDTLSQTMGELDAAFEAHNWSLLITLAQSLHSEASSMDAMELAQFCNQLRQLNGAEDLPRAGEIIAQMRPLALAIDREIASLPE